MLYLILEAKGAKTALTFFCSFLRKAEQKKGIKATKKKKTSRLVYCKGNFFSLLILGNRFPSRKYKFPLQKEQFLSCRGNSKDSMGQKIQSPPRGVCIFNRKHWDVNEDIYLVYLRPAGCKINVDSFNSYNSYIYWNLHWSQRAEI